MRSIADLPEMAERRRQWTAHNALRGERPLVLCFPEGAWDELIADSDCACEHPKLRQWELQLRRRIYWWDHLRDDAAIEPYFNIGWHITTGNYGVDVPHLRAEARGSYVWDPPIKNLDRDLDKLHFRPLVVDRDATYRDIELANGVFGDLLPVRQRGKYWWTMGMTWEAAKLIGLEHLMLYMCDNPDGLHRLMAWLRDEHMHFLSWFEDQHLLSDQNEDDYVGSGGLGYSDELPQPDRGDGEPARVIDQWGFGESQETVGISPAMFDEFVLPYQLPLFERFGLNCYGCCEGLHLRIDSILERVPRLRRVSASPWVDQQILADRLAGDYIFSRKPNPTLVCTGFNEAAIRRDVRETLAIAGQGPLEIIMKDTHTLQGQRDRLARWVKIAREEVDDYVSSKNGPRVRRQPRD